MKRKPIKVEYILYEIIAFVILSAIISFVTSFFMPSCERETTFYFCLALCFIIILPANFLFFKDYD